MRNLGSGLLVVGLGALLVAAPLPASAQDSVAYSSYAAAQFVSGKNALGEVVDIVGDGIEEEGASSTFPDGGEQFTASPLQALDRLTIPVGDTLLDSEIGPVGSYAQTGDGGLAFAASGAVTSDGIVHVGGGSQPATSNASLSLSGGALEPLTDYVADVRLDLGAVTSQTRYADAGGSLERSYSLAGSRLVLQVPALQAIADGLGGGSVGLPEEISLGSAQVCETLVSLLPVDEFDCSGVPSIGEIRVRGADAVSDGLVATTDTGLSFDLTTGSLIVDLETLLKSLDLDLNNLPENTDLLNTVLPALAQQLPVLVDDLLDTVAELVDRLEIVFVLPGAGEQELPLDQLTDPLGLVLQQVREQLVGVVEQAAGPLADGLDQLTDALASVVQVLVNVPDEYAARADTGVEPTDKRASLSALRVKLLAVGGEEGQLADLLLANSLVDTAATQVPACTTDCDGDDPTAAGGGGGPKGWLPHTGVDLLAPVFFGGLALLGLGYLLIGRRSDDEDTLTLG